MNAATVSRAIALFGALLLILAPSPSAFGITWTTVDYFPGVATQLHGVSGDDALGSWYDPVNNTGGQFLLSENVFTPLQLNYPGSSGTVAWKMDGQTIVGWYFPDSDLSAIAYRFDGTTYQSLALSGSTESLAFDVSNGSVVGTYMQGGSIHGVFGLGSNPQTLDYPGAETTRAQATFDGIVVGNYGVQGDLFPESHGFVYEAGNWKSLHYPKATSTRPLGVSSELIVGEFTIDGPSGFVQDSFLYDGAKFTLLKYPGSLYTNVRDIDGNRIVGSYVDTDGNQHGFIATVPEPPTAVLLSLGILLVMCAKALRASLT